MDKCKDYYNKWVPKQGEIADEGDVITNQRLELEKRVREEEEEQRQKMVF